LNPRDRLGRALEEAVPREALTQPLEVRARSGSLEAVARVRDGDRLAVELEELRLRSGGAPAPERLDRALRRLPEALAPLGATVHAVERDPSLGGAVLRSAPDTAAEGGWFEVRTDGREVSIGRPTPRAGVRRPGTFPLSREALRKLLSGLADALADEPPATSPPRPPPSRTPS
jgi:hypothetical protein